MQQNKDIKNLQIAHWNANGVKYKIHELTYFITSHQIQLMSINETKLKVEDKFYIPGYKIVRKDRPGDNRAGGVMLIIKEEIKFTRTNINIKTIEAVGIKINNTTFVSAYLRPQEKLDTQELNSLLNTSSSVIILGDLNCKHSGWGKQQANQNGNILFNFCQNRNINIIHPSEFTYQPPQRGKKPSVIDIGIVKNLSSFIDIKVLHELSSDHFPLVLRFLNVNAPKIPSHRLNIAKTDWEKYRNYIKNELVTENKLLTPLDLDNNILEVTKIINDALEHATPKIKTRKPDQLPNDIVKLIKHKNYLRRKFQRTKNELYRQLQNHFQLLIKIEIKLWRNVLWDERLYKLDIKDNSIWMMTKSLTKKISLIIPALNDNNSMVETPREKANALAKQYKATHELTSKMGSKTHDENILNKRNKILKNKVRKIHPVTPKEIGNIIRKLKNRKAPGKDKISSKMLKNLPKKMIVQLNHIYNACFKLCYFPSAWKEAVILPIPKPGKDPTIPSSYRPISLLSNLGKTLERLILNRIRRGGTQEATLKDQQYGFREKRSTARQLSKVVNDIRIQFNLKRSTAAMFLDIEKAFDTVWHAGLITKLHDARLEQYLIKIINSFLSDRKFRVKIDDELSDEQDVPAGVPQGSILGPVLFINYINDLPGFKDTNIAQFADDTAVYSISKKPKLALSRLEKHARYIENYFDLGKIKVNPTKTELIIFSNEKAPPERKIKVFNADITSTESVKYLGVHLDRKLNFITHIAKTKQKCHMIISKLFPLLINKKLSVKNKLLIYNAIIKPAMLYACPIWGNLASNAQIQKLQIVQNKCLRLALNMKRRTRLSTLHELANVPFVSETIQKLVHDFYNSPSLSDIVKLPNVNDMPFHLKYPLTYK